jgi:hypothetical protein
VGEAAPRVRCLDVFFIWSNLSDNLRWEKQLGEPTKKAVRGVWAPYGLTSLACCTGAIDADVARAELNPLYRGLAIGGQPVSEVHAESDHSKAYEGKAELT